MSTSNEHLLNLIRAARPWVEQAGTISGYGFYRPENPHDFHPDPESCSDEEMNNHKAACEAWDRGEFKAPEQSGWVHNEAGEAVAHVLRAPWGIGSYTDFIPEAADLLAAMDCALKDEKPQTELRELAKLAYRALCDAEAVINTIDGECTLESMNLAELQERIKDCAVHLFTVLRLPVSEFRS